MPKLVLLLVAALAAALTPVGATADVPEGTIGPPPFYLRGNVGPYTTAPEARLYLAEGTPNLPDAEGPQNLSWDVQVARADMRATSRPAWRAARTGTTVRNHLLPIASGQVLCIRARQHSWGVTSAWSRFTCVVRARDDERLRRTGPVRVVDDWRYADGHASVLTRRTAFYLGGVPAGAKYGPVYTNSGPDGPYCTDPTWRIAGQRLTAELLGVGHGAISFGFRRARVSGTAVLRTTYGPSCAVGGFVVVPTWVP